MKAIQLAVNTQAKIAEAFLIVCILGYSTVTRAEDTLDWTNDPTGGKDLSGLISGGGKTLFGQITYWIFQILAPFVGGLFVWRGFMKLTKDQSHERQGWWKDLLIGFIMMAFTFFIFRLRNTIMAW